MMSDGSPTRSRGRLGRLTLIRAGRGGAYAEEFQSHGMVAIGWPEVGDLGGARTREEIGSRLAAAFPYCKRMQIVSMLGQLCYFSIEIALDQFVLTYDPMEKAYLLGRVTGPYAYRPDLIVDLPHTRPVRWIRRVQRDALTRATLNSLGSIRTIFSISQAASTEILALPHQLSKQ